MEPNVEMEALKQKVTDLEQRLEKLESAEYRPFGDALRGEDADKAFMDSVEKAAPQSLQALIRHTRIEQWARASVGLSLALVLKIRNNVSVRAWDDFVGYAREVEKLRMGSMFREEILRTLRELVYTGELVVAGDVGFEGWGMESLVTPLRPLANAVMGEVPKVDPAVKEWLEGILLQAGAAPLQRPSMANMIQV